MCKDFLIGWDILKINRLCPADAVLMTGGNAVIFAKQLASLLLVLCFDVDGLKAIIWGCRHDHKKGFAHRKKLHGILICGPNFFSDYLSGSAELGNQYGRTGKRLTRHGTGEGLS